MTQAVGVVGLGNWGTAIAHHLACKGLSVLAWSKNTDVVDSINRTHQNPKYLKNTSIHQGVKVTQSLEDVIARELVIYALPSAALESLKDSFQKVSRSTVLISATKGIDRSTLTTPLEFLRKNAPHAAGFCVISGPSFASDLSLQRPCGVVAASDDEAIARRVAELFSSSAMKVYISTDVKGVEWGGVIKNVIAIAAGICDGMGLGDSARAGIITRGLAEMIRVSTAFGADPRTLSGLSGLGDLVMTASCDQSRNRTVGIRLGKGETLKQILDTLGSVSEGVHVTPLVLELARSHSVEMPIAEAVAAVLDGSASPEQLVQRLITRPLKREF